MNEIQIVKQGIERVQAGISEMLGGLVEALDDKKREKLMQGMYEILRRAPENDQSMKALEQAPESVLNVGLVAINNDLSLEPLHRELYAIARWNKNKGLNEFTPQLGYMAPIKFLERTGLYHHPRVMLVYEGCEVVVDVGNLLSPIRHTPWEVVAGMNYDTDDATWKKAQGKLRFGYLLAPSRDGGAPLFEIVSARSIRKGYDSSGYRKDGTHHPNHLWKSHFDDMARKTVAIRACRFVPMREEDRAIVMNELIQLGQPTTSDEPRQKSLKAELDNEPSEVDEFVSTLDNGGE